MKDKLLKKGDKRSNDINIVYNIKIISSCIDLRSIYDRLR